jgi:4-carboxymuconolactone decarboxylase
MMNKGRLLKWILFLFLMGSINTMNAQNNTTANQPLNAQQLGIVSISALTAVGDLKQLKTQLNTGLDAGLTTNEIICQKIINNHPEENSCSRQQWPVQD